jgi:hypothetical protein
VLRPQGLYQSIHSTILCFVDSTFARTVSQQWHRILATHTSERRSDQYALREALFPYTSKAMDGSHEWPLANLWHDGSNSRTINGRKPETW